MWCPLLQGDVKEQSGTVAKDRRFVAHAVASVHSTEVAAQFLPVMRSSHHAQVQEFHFAGKLAYEHLAAVTAAGGPMPHTSRPRLTGPGLDVHERVQWYLPPRRPYSRRELLADRIVNFTGAALSWPCCIILTYFSLRSSLPFMQQLCYVIHGVGLVAMMNLSALYHHFAWDWEQAPRVYSPLDQVGINSMIVGCFAPLMFVCDGYRVLLSVCVLGTVGLVLQVLRLARINFRPLSRRKGARWTILDLINVVHYIGMGLLVLPNLPAMIEVLPFYAMFQFATGGAAYLVGVPFLLFERLEFHQAYWHLFVLVGSALFYMGFFLQIVSWEGRSL